MTFVTSNEFLTFDYAEKLRKKLQYQTLTKEIYTYEEYVVFPNEKVSAVINTLLKVNKTIVASNLNSINVDEIKKKELFFHNELFKYKESQIRFYSDNSIMTQILRKIDKYPKIEADIDIMYGLQTENKWNNEEIHAIDEFKIIKENNLELEYIKKLGLGQEIKKYEVLDEGKYIIYLTEKNFTDDIKNIISYIDKKLSVNDKHKYYLRKPKETAIKFFEASEKIIVRKNGTCFKFGLDNQEKYWKSDVIMILPKEKINMYFLLGILNSRVISLYLSNKADARKDGFLINQKHIHDIPVPKVEEYELIKLIEEKVKKIFRKEDIEKNEIELEELIYKIYELNYDEIEFINNNYKHLYNKYRCFCLVKKIFVNNFKRGDFVSNGKEENSFEDDSKKYFKEALNFLYNNKCNENDLKVYFKFANYEINELKDEPVEVFINDILEKFRNRNIVNYVVGKVGKNPDEIKLKLNDYDKECIKILYDIFEDNGRENDYLKNCLGTGENVGMIG